MKPLILIALITLLLLPGLLLFIGKKRVNKEIEKDIARLTSQGRDISNQTYNESKIENLPPPVQRYFRYSLREGQPYVNSVHLLHEGQFKTDLEKEWIDIKGEQYFIADKPGFLWIGRTSLFTARDMFIAGEGRIKVSLLSLFDVVDGRGGEYNQGELLRWLGESVWFPTNLLPGKNLQWLPLDEDTAELKFNYQGLELSYKVSFNQQGMITELETMRHMGKEGLKTWVGKVGDYKEVRGMMIPMSIEAIWRLDEGDHSYARFNVTEIEYNYQ